MLRAESEVRSWDKLFVVQILPCENFVPKNADLEVPGVRNGVGSVLLLDDLLCLIGA